MSRSPELWVWGVDCGKRRVAIGCTRAQEDRTYEFEVANSRDDVVDLLILHRHTLRVAERLATKHAPLAVFVEQPTGKARTPDLMAAWGVIRMTLYLALEARFAHPVTIFTIGVTEWKKLIHDNGQADKAESLLWAADRLGVLPTEDEAEALAIAHAGALQLNVQREAA